MDPLLHDGLKKLLEYTPAEDVEAVFCRTFEVEWDEFGAKRTHELVPGGANVPVTGANRADYVEKLLHWLLYTSVEAQFNDLYDGFSRVVHPSCTLLFSADDLELLMVGTPHLDFKELEVRPRACRAVANSAGHVSSLTFSHPCCVLCGGGRFPQASTQYVSGSPDDQWDASHPTVQAFWKVVHAMTLEDKQKLLMFATGSNKAPIGGLKNLGFKLQRMSADSDLLPTSHTCFNVLLLPAYSSEAKLKQRLYTAMNECEGFGLK